MQSFKRRWTGTKKFTVEDGKLQVRMDRYKRVHSRGCNTSREDGQVKKSSQ
jgi:hypothetical protein